MAGSPPVLILDEPTNDLDPQRRKQVWDNLRQINRQQGATIIFITHDAIEAEKIIQRVGIMRQVGALSYFATLPIYRYALVVATVLAFFVLSLPAVLINLVFGSLYLRVALAPSWLALIIIPLIAIALAGVGALIGSAAPTPEAAGSLNLLVTMGLMGLGPVVVPPERLPPMMIWLGWLSPAAYAASALRQTLLGPVEARLILDMGVLLGVTALTFWMARRKMDWRQK
jgi:ABC-2 type transport system permease protein